jgi:hypothetical protein
MINRISPAPNQRLPLHSLRWEIANVDALLIKTSFLWIHEGERGRVEVEEKLTKLRNRTVVLCWPRHDVHWVSVEQVDVDLAVTVARIRPIIWDAGDGGSKGGKAISIQP